MRQKRKRTRQQAAENHRLQPLAYASSADFSSTDDDEGNTIVEAALEEVMAVDLGTQLKDLAEEVDESDLSDSDLSGFDSETDTEREEDGFTTDFEDGGLDSDSGDEELVEIAKIASVLSNGTEIVRHRFPYLSMRIFFEDFACLMDEGFVNDTIVDFCLNHFVFNVLPEDVYRIHALPSVFFYMMQMQLLEDAGNKADSLAEKLWRRYSRLSCFVEDVDLFENDFMVIPLNDVNHWSLCIVCCPNRLLELGGRGARGGLSQRRASLEKFGGHVREFLQFAYIHQNGFSEDLVQRFSEENLPVVIPNKLPQQTATYDCGLFMLEYARSFFINPPSMRKVIDGQFDFLAEYPTFSVTRSRATLRNEILSMSADREHFERMLGYKSD
ncbi:ULP-PROTEASE domain-containing protein [Aphelenchoides fujianensis]|nr:ULP-PROTEASE domain-containing protein [Aphelenchoides fujianensis]